MSSSSKCGKSGAFPPQLLICNSCVPPYNIMQLHFVLENCEQSRIYIEDTLIPFNALVEESIRIPDCTEFLAQLFSYLDKEMALFCYGPTVIELGKNRNPQTSGDR